MAQKTDNVNTKNTFSFHPVDVFHALYNVQLSDKYENILKDMFCNYDYLIVGLEDQCVGNDDNNTTQISSVKMNVGMVDIHIF